MPIILPVDEELTLKQFAEEDANAVFALINRNRHHLSQNGDSTAERYPTKQAFVDEIHDPLDPRKLDFGIWTPEALVGSVSVCTGNDGRAEVTCYLGQEFEKKGYATRAVRRLMEYAFEMGTLVVWAKIVEGNKSRRILERIGGFNQTYSLRLTTGQNVLYFERRR